MCVSERLAEPRTDAQSLGIVLSMQKRPTTKASKDGEKPPWICDSNQDRKWMEEWVNNKLDEKLDASMHKTNAATSDVLETFKDLWIDTAIKERDINRLIALSRELGDLRYIFERLLKKPNRGRPRGYGRVLSHVEGASSHVDWVYEIWQEHYGRKNRAMDNGPSAIEIVVRRFKELGFSVSETKLADFRSKNGRFSPRKSAN